MAENKLTDARVRSATHARDGSYLSDGGSLRLRLLPPSRNHPRGARLAEFHFKLKDAAGNYKNGALHLGTVGDEFRDAAGKVRPFTLKDAREGRDAARELVGRGIDPRDAARLAAAEHADDHRRRLAALDNRRTVRQAFALWRDLYLSAHHKDGGVSVEQMFKLHVLPAVGDKPLDELRRADITHILDTLTAQGKRRSANMALQMVRQFTRWCLMREWLTTDPTFSVTKAAAGGRLKPRSRALSPLEIVELRDKLPSAKLHPRIVHAAWLLLATGARVGELSGAAVAEFDLEARTWLMPETKNGEPHLVHLSDFALQHVRALLKLGKGSAYLLPSRNRGAAEDHQPREDRPLAHYSIGKMLHDRQRAEPLKGRTAAAGTLNLARGEWTAHDLRRTMATQMREHLRISTDVVERCLNHKPQGIVGVYQTGELLAERKEAFDAWGKELKRLMRLSCTNVVALDPKAA